MMQRYYYMYNNNNNNQQTKSLCVTVNARFYALLAAAVWCLIQWLPETLGIYICWHVLQTTTAINNVGVSWQEVRRIRQELQVEYEQIMSDGTNDGGGNNNNNNLVMPQDCCAVSFRALPHRRPNY